MLELAWFGFCFYTLVQGVMLVVIAISSVILCIIMVMKIQLPFCTLNAAELNIFLYSFVRSLNTLTQAKCLMCMFYMAVLFMCHRMQDTLNFDISSRTLFFVDQSEKCWFFAQKNREKSNNIRFYCQFVRIKSTIFHSFRHFSIVFLGTLCAPRTINTFFFLLKLS